MKILPGSRRRYYAARVGVFLVMAALIAGMGGAYYVGGGNTPLSQDLEIQTWYDLDAVRDNPAGNHTLMNDLDSTTDGYEELASPTANGGKGWEPIESLVIPSSGCGGGIPDVPPVVGLTGTFDGQGYEIRDLFINRPGEDYVGLFRSVDEGGIVKNVGVVNVIVTSGWYVGGLAGLNFDGTVSNSYSTGSVTGNEYVGGLVGRNGGIVSDSYSTNNVTGDSFVGGLVGANHYGTVSNSYSSGNVTGNSFVGGLVGENSNTVNNSFWDTETSGQTTSNGGTGKNTTEMQDIDTFLGAGWDIIEVAPGSTNTTYIWNIVNNVTYPFLSWQS